MNDAPGRLQAGAAPGTASAPGHAPSPERRPPRRRPRVAAVLLLVAAAGLASRRVPLPGVLAEYPGDALYATAAFCGLALLAPGARTLALAAGALGFAAGVEFAQLLDWPWLRTLRGTSVGALLLGHGFQAADLLAHVAGVALACLADVTFRAGSPSRGPDPDRLPHRSSAPPA